MMLDFLWDESHVLIAAINLCLGGAMGALLLSYLRSRALKREQCACKEAEAESVPVKPHNGNLLKIKDLAKQLDAVESIYEKEVALINSLLDAQGDIVLACDAHGVICYFNLVSEKIFQIDPQSAVGKHYTRVMEDLGYQAIPQDFPKSIVTSDAPIPFVTTPIKTKSNHLPIVEWVGSPLKNDSGEVVYILQKGRVKSTAAGNVNQDVKGSGHYADGNRKSVSRAGVRQYSVSAKKASNTTRRHLKRTATT